MDYWLCPWRILETVASTLETDSFCPYVKNYFLESYKGIHRLELLLIVISNYNL
jgi:hypothetical protein